MAETTGLVQRLTILSGISIACAWVGPTPGNAEIFYVLREQAEPPNSGAFLNNIVDTLATAMVTRREVVVIHPNNDARIDSLRIEPA